MQPISLTTKQPHAALLSHSAGGGLEYLMQMPIHALTEERALRLRRQADEAADRLRRMRGVEAPRPCPGVMCSMSVALLSFASFVCVSFNSFPTFTQLT